MVGRLHQRVDGGAAFGMWSIATEDPAVADGAVGKANGGAGEGGVAGEEAIADPAHPCLQLHQAGFRRANQFIVRRQLQGLHPCQQLLGFTVGQHGHPALAGCGIKVHSVLHGEFNHVRPGQADGVLRSLRFARAVVQGSHAQRGAMLGIPRILLSLAWRDGR